MSEFNFKSQICTSREQSKRLLSLGLKKENADMNYTRLSKGDHWTLFIGLPMGYDEIPNEYLLPAWSLHRLIEMMPENIFTGVRSQWHRVMYNCVLTYEEGDDSLVSFSEANIYDRCISCIEWLIKEGYFKKEYLV